MIGFTMHLHQKQFLFIFKKIKIILSCIANSVVPTYGGFWRVLACFGVASHKYCPDPVKTLIQNNLKGELWIIKINKSKSAIVTLL